MGQPRIGVVAYQGAVPEHIEALEHCGAKAIPVKWPEDLDGLAGLVIPGGESTTIGDLMQTYGLLQAVNAWERTGGAIYGTCAGAILMASEIRDGKEKQPSLRIVPMAVRRNGFGRQVESCETSLGVRGIGDTPFPAIFIRAPYFEDLGPGVEILSHFEGKVVAIRYGRHLCTAFHPELTGDHRIHQFFIAMIEGGNVGASSQDGRESLRDLDTKDKT